MHLGGAASTIAVGGAPRFIVAASVWTTTFDRPLTRIDPASNLVAAQFIGGDGGDCVSVGFDAVWLSNLRMGTIWRILLAAFDGCQQAPTSPRFRVRR